VKAVFPDAQVDAVQIRKRPIRVTISSGGRELVRVDQRDLFGKYGWPAEKPITEALLKFKADETAGPTAAAVAAE